MMEPPDKVDCMDVSPKQILSVATSLIPFLEHNDAPRALMGSNMQRQAVPLVRPETPLVMTGMEAQAAQDSGQVILAERRRRGDSAPTRAASASSTTATPSRRSYPLLKFVRSNQGTCINQRPTVKKGDRVGTGDAARRQLLDQQGRAGARPERALRVHELAGLQLRGRDHPLGSARARRQVHLDPHREARGGGARHQARARRRSRATSRTSAKSRCATSTRTASSASAPRCNAGDILVGKITPKGETELTAEEKLLRAIFGEKAREVKDTSLRVPHGERGKVIDVKVFRRDDARRAARRRERAGARLHRPAAQGLRRRQDGRPPRQQGRHRPHPARRGHAVPRGRHARRHHPQPDRRAEPHERRPGAGDAPRLGGERARLPRRHAGVRRRDRQARSRTSSARAWLALQAGRDRARQRTATARAARVREPRRPEAGGVPRRRKATTPRKVLRRRRSIGAAQARLPRALAREHRREAREAVSPTRSCDEKVDEAARSAIAPPTWGKQMLYRRPHAASRSTSR